MTRIFSASAIALIASLTSANAATEIQWWHAMGGELGAKLEEIAKNFNESQTEYVIKPSYKGNYVETMTAAIAASAIFHQTIPRARFRMGAAMSAITAGRIPLKAAST